MRNIPKDSKIAVAMSGGVDSGTAAYLLVEAGYEVVGIFMQHLDNMEKQKEAAMATAEKLDIPLEIVDYRNRFQEVVIDYFVSEYKSGRTPNPCVVCNKYLKFGDLLQEAQKLNCDYLATGHYARLRRRQKNSESATARKKETPNFLELLMARDRSKDQSYFLWQLEQEQLEHTLFPIGGKSKASVVNIAYRKDLPVAKRPESFEVCFLKEGLRTFLKKHIPSEIRPGPVKDLNGKTIGKHYGLPLYTYGQRRGFEVDKYQGIPQYVVEKDYENNVLIVGRGKESEIKEFGVGGVNWILLPRGSHVGCRIRIRHLGRFIPGTVIVRKDEQSRVVLNYAERGVAPGQSAVFYDGEVVLGGGVISFKS